MAQKLKRNINMGFRVNEDEKFFIEKKMEEAGWTNFRTFVLHALVRGKILKIELTEIREMNTLLRNVSNNINQIAARVNSTNRVYETDMAEIKSRQSEMWEQQNKIIAAITKITEVKDERTSFFHPGKFAPAAQSLQVLERKEVI